MSLSQPEQDALIHAALQARQHAYAPFSDFAVGAALADAQGGMHCGCNVENVSYGLTICAERVALFSAVASGHRQFVGLAVATAGAYPPCGACRQVLLEFCRDLPIWLVDAKQPDRIVPTTLDCLQPFPFRLGESSPAKPLE